MKKVLPFLMMTMFLTTSVAMADGGCGKCYKCCGESYVQKKTEKLTKVLDLNESQVSQVEAILKTKMESKQAIKDKSAQEMQVVSDNFQTSMNQVLNADQQATLQKMMDKNKEQKKCQKKKRFFIF